MWFFFINKRKKNKLQKVNLKYTGELLILNLSRSKQVELIENNVLNKNLTNNFIKGKPLIFKNNFSLIFIKYFLRGGLNLKVLNYFQIAFTQLYNFIFEDVEIKKKKFFNFMFIFNMLSLNINFFNLNTFFFFLTKYIIYNFYFKVTVLPKFLKKKLKTKYSIEPVFLEKTKRHKKTLRILSLNIDLHKSILLKNRFFNSLKDLALNAKKSSFFLEKTAVYLKIFKLLKKKKKFKAL